MTRKRGGIFYWRRRWPGGRGEAAFSLGTRRFREAEHLAAVADEAFEGVWKGMTKPAPHLVDPTPRGGSPMDDPAERARAVAAAVAAVRAELATVLMVRRAAREAAERAGVQPRARGRRKPPLAFRTAGVRSGSASFTVTTVGAPAPVVVAPQMPATPPPPPKPPPKVASSFVEEHFAKRVNRGARAQVIAQDRMALDMFFELRGDRPFTDYVRADITEHLDTVRRLPRLHGKSPHYRDRPVLEIIAEADRREEKRRLKEGTVERHFSALTQFFKFAVDKGQITKTQRADLLDDFTFRMEEGAREQRGAWTIDELIALFTSALYTGCHRDRRWMKGPHKDIRDAKFWIPLLALFHGARVEEFCDLCPSSDALGQAGR